MILGLVVLPKKGWFPMAEKTLTVPSQPLPPDLVKEMAMDIGKEIAAYIERQYPQAVAATSNSFLTSVRNAVYNEIIAAIGTSNVGEIEQRLERRKRDRRKLRALWKAARTIQPGDYQKADDILAGRLPPEPDF